MCAHRRLCMPHHSLSSLLAPLSLILTPAQQHQGLREESMGRDGEEEAETSASPGKDTCSNVVENSEREPFEAIQNSSSSSISLSAEDFLELTSLEMEEGKTEDTSSRGGTEDDSGSETASSRLSTSNSTRSKFSASDTEMNPKTRSQWRGFLHKMKKAPAKGLQNLHPSIPNITTIKKLRKKKNMTNSMPALPPQLDVNFYCFESSWKNFSLAELQTATNNFSHENLIGEGGYSEVYKGCLEDGRLLAIKRLIRGTPEEMISDFLCELGILVHVNHQNIANVIGYGVEGGMHLVLPLSPHGSLASMLSGEKGKLDWGNRYNIALGTALGLSYLHEGCQRRIVHRDIKAANILLSEDYEPQISDFGLAKWLPDQWTHLNISQYEGTFGYLPPEFFLHGIVDEKTDVYAYGVLLLELTTGRPALDQSQKSLVMWARPMLTTSSGEKLVDPVLVGAYDSEQLNRMILIASQCIHQSPSERPKMSQVVRMLQGDEGIYESKKKFQKRPAFKRASSVKFFDDEEYDSIAFDEQAESIKPDCLDDDDARSHEEDDMKYLQELQDFNLPLLSV